MSKATGISTQKLGHTFGTGDTKVKVLHDVQLEIGKGELIILMGPSGSGKTTLLTLVGCLRNLQEGSAIVLGQELRGADEATLARMRRQFGFIFQAHNLHSSLTALENVRMGLEVHGASALGNWKTSCRHVLELVGLGDRVNYLPSKLSGGQKQRVAVARALVGNPQIVFADEPTAALDKVTGHQIATLLRKLADERGTSIFMVTHDHRILDCADRIIQMEDGRIVTENASKDSVQHLD